MSMSLIDHHAMMCVYTHPRNIIQLLTFMCVALESLTPSGRVVRVRILCIIVFSHSTNKGIDAYTNTILWYRIVCIYHSILQNIH